MAQVHIFCTVAAIKREIIEARCTHSVQLQIIAFEVGLTPQVSVNAAYGSRFLEPTPRSFFNNRCLCYDDGATNMFA